MPNKVLLCGCGWLGEQLLQPLQTNCYQIHATSRRAEKLSQLAHKNITAAPFQLGEPFPFQQISIDRDSVIVLSLPPGRRNPSFTDFANNMCNLIDAFAERVPAHVIFTSTTAVYGDGYDGVVTENTPTAPATGSAKAHVEIEHYLAERLPEQFTILRLAGLVGPDRHPIRTLAGRTLTAPNRVVNLIHGEDVTAAIMKLIALGPQQRALHLCATEHPQRATYYQDCAHKLGLMPPEFSGNEPNLKDKGKRIDARDTIARLGLVLTYPSPFDMLVSDSSR